MLLEPIMISTYILLSAILCFNHYLKKNNSKLLIISSVMLLISVGLFVITYTDTMIDTTLVIGEFMIVTLLFYLPCYLKKKNYKYYHIVFVLSHVLGLSILSGMRTLLLVSHPFYYLYPMISFSSMYILKHTENKMNALALIASFVLIRMMVPIDIEAPFTFNFIDHSASIDNDASEFALNESKPIIRAVDYYHTNYNGHIKTVNDILTDDGVIVLITTDMNEKYRFVYSNNTVEEE